MNAKSPRRREENGRDVQISASLWRHGVLAFIFNAAARTAGLVLCLVVLLGCTPRPPAPTTQPANIRDRQEQALKDPMNYKVEPGKKDPHRNDPWYFDKEGFNKDVKDVFNP